MVWRANGRRSSAPLPAAAMLALRAASYSRCLAALGLLRRFENQR